MRALDRLISFVFSIIMLVISIILVLVGAGVIESQMVLDMLKENVFTNKILAGGFWNPVTIAGLILFLASLKTTIFLSLFKTKDKSPILVKTDHGEVEIAQETITNTVRNVGFSFENIKDVQAKMVKKKKGIIIYTMVLVYANSNIREITEEMQKQIKEVVKATTGVTVLEVNIKVKNTCNKQKKTVESPENGNTQEKKSVLVEEVKTEEIEKAEKEEIPLESAVEEVEKESHLLTEESASAKVDTVEAEIASDIMENQVEITELNGKEKQ